MLPKTHFPIAINHDYEKTEKNTTADTSVFMGKVQMYGSGSYKEAALAITYFKNALKQSNRQHPEALYQIGVAAMNGVGLPVDYDRAARFLVRAHKNGHDAAIHQLETLSQRIEQGVRNTIPQDEVDFSMTLDFARAQERAALQVLHDKLSIVIDKAHIANQNKVEAISHAPNPNLVVADIAV